MRRISMQKGKNLTVEEGFEVFIKRCVIKNLIAQTEKIYRNHYVVFRRFLGDVCLLSDVNKDVVDDFILYLKEHNQCKVNYSQVSRHNY